MLTNRNRLMNGMAAEMDRLMSSALNEFEPVTNPRRRADAPALNLWEDDGTLHVEMELPGISMEDLDLSVFQNRLTIRGQRRPMSPEGARVLRRERAEGEFTRTITFGTEIDSENVSATLRDGILHVALPRAEAARPRRIEVRSLPAETSA